MPYRLPRLPVLDDRGYEGSFDDFAPQDGQEEPPSPTLERLRQRYEQEQADRDAQAQSTYDIQSEPQAETPAPISLDELRRRRLAEQTVGPENAPETQQYLNESPLGRLRRQRAEQGRTAVPTPVELAAERAVTPIEPLAELQRRLGEAGRRVGEAAPQIALAPGELPARAVRRATGLPVPIPSEQIARVTAPATEFATKAATPTSPLDVALTALPAAQGFRAGRAAGEGILRAAARGLLEGIATDPTKPGTLRQAAQETASGILRRATSAPDPDMLDSIVRNAAPDDTVIMYHGVRNDPAVVDVINAQGLTRGGLTPDPEVARLHAQNGGVENPVVLRFEVPRRAVQDESWYFVPREPLPVAGQGPALEHMSPLQRARAELASERGSIEIPGRPPEEVPETPGQAPSGAARTPPEVSPPAAQEPELSPLQQARRDLAAERGQAPPPPPEPPAGGAVPPEEPPGAAANIRLDKYPEDIRTSIKEWADANPDAVQEARRGVRSDEQVRADAQTLVDDLGGNFDKLQRRWKPSEAWNAEELVAIRGALNEATQGVMDAAEAARLVDSTENHLRLAEAILKQQRIQQTVHGVTAEAGRALRSFRQAADVARTQGDVDRMRELLQATLGKAEGKDISELAAAIQALDINDPVAVNTFLRSVNKPGFFDYLLEYWYNSVLSGPFTHMRNIIGNTAATVTEPLRRVSAAGVEAGLARAQGRPAERFWEEAPASVIGGIQGIPEGVRGALQTMITGFNPQAVGRVELRRQAFPGAVGRVVRLPSTGLEAMDAFFHSINYRMSLWADATRQARAEGLTGSRLQDRVAELLAEPTPTLVKQSSENAERLLFRGDPGTLAREFSRMKQTTPALNFLLPFVRTPTNLLKFGVRNSPLGLLDVPMWRRVAAGSAQGSDELAQTLMGSTVAAGVAALVANGSLDLTLGPPTNAAERDQFYREGKIPFAAKIPGVGWVQYSQIPNLAETLTAVASTVEAVREGEDAGTIASRAGGTIGQSLLDRSYLSGLSDFLEAVADPVRNAERFGMRQVTGFVPFSSAQRQIATAIDPTVREPQGLSETIQAGIPGLTGNVPARLTAFGEEAQRGLPSPIQVTPDRQSAVDAELERLNVNVGFVGRTIAGEELGRDEQRAFQVLSGQATKGVIGQRIQSETYQGLSDRAKERDLERSISLVRNAARDILRPDPESPDVRLRGQSITEFVLDKLNYEDKRLSLGYEPRDKVAAELYDGKRYAEISTAEKKSVDERIKDMPDSRELDRQNPDMDALGWRFSGKTASLLQSAEAANQALVMVVEGGIVGRPIKLEGFDRPINQTADSLRAWQEHEKMITWYSGTGDGQLLSSANRDKEAQRLYRKPYELLSSEQRGVINGNLRATARKQHSDLDGVLAWWDKDAKPLTQQGQQWLGKMIDQYGRKSPDAAIER